MAVGEPFEHRSSRRSEGRESPPPVVEVAGAVGQPGRVCSVDEADDGVIAQLQRVGEVATEGGAVVVATDGEEQLVLGRCESLGAGGVLGEPEEHPQGMPDWASAR